MRVPAAMICRPLPQWWPYLATPTADRSRCISPTLCKYRIAWLCCARDPCRGPAPLAALAKYKAGFMPTGRARSKESAKRANTEPQHVAVACARLKWDDADQDQLLLFHSRDSVWQPDPNLAWVRTCPQTKHEPDLCGSVRPARSCCCSVAMPPSTSVAPTYRSQRPF